MNAKVAAPARRGLLHSLLGCNWQLEESTPVSQQIDLSKIAVEDAYSGPRMEGGPSRNAPCSTLTLHAAPATDVLVGSTSFRTCHA